MKLRQRERMDLRAAVTTALGLTPVSRLIAIDAGELADAAALAVYAAVSPHTAGDPRAVVADPLRLPFVAAIADHVLATIDGRSEPIPLLREIWRVLAPAGALVAVVPTSSSRSLKSLFVQWLVSRQVRRWLVAAMFEIVSCQITRSGLVIRAEKRDGFAAQRRSTATVQTAATA